MHARALGKLSHSDPLVLWAVVLRQIQSYENLVKPVVESARYITPLGADTIVFMLLDAFSNPDKDRTKTDGTSTSLWLRALAAFAGELCRRHAQLIDSRPIVRYVANQLAAGNPKDLVILRELVSAMTAIDPLANLSDAQVAAMGGGAVLRAEAVHPTVPTVKMPVQPGTVVGPEPIVEKRGVTGRSAAKLAQALRDDGLAVPLLVAVAQARESCVFAVPEEEAHMKHLSSLFDNVRPQRSSLSPPPAGLVFADTDAAVLRSLHSRPRSCSSLSTFCSSTCRPTSTRPACRPTSSSQRRTACRLASRSTCSGPSSRPSFGWPTPRRRARRRAPRRPGSSTR